MADTALPPPRYSLWHTLNVALMLGMRALAEVRELAAAKPQQAGFDVAEVERMIAEAFAKQPSPKRGPEGPPGKFLPPKPWEKAIHYEGVLVTHRGSTYCAAQDTADEPPHRDWVLVAARGDDAPIGEVCGLHVPERKYRKFDIVAWNGSEWRAKHDDPGQLPGEGWAIAAKVGKPGRPGDQGPKGDPGPQGRPAATISGWTRDGYRAIPVLSDGTRGAALDIRQFFELYDGEKG